MMWRLIVVCLVYAIGLANAACSNKGNFLTSQTGPATYYGAYTGGGACSLDPTPTAGSGIYTTVAIAANVFGTSQTCGMCINVTSLDSSAPLPKNFLAYVNNLCPECVNFGIDVGQNGDGIWNVKWNSIPCPVATSNIQFLFQGSNNWYIKLQVRNTRYPVVSVEMQQGSTWTTLSRSDDNFFIGNFGTAVTTPFNVRVTATTGDVITDSVPRIDTTNTVLAGTKQFLDCSGSTSSGVAATTTASVQASTTTTTSGKVSTTTTTSGKATTTTTSTKATSTSAKASTTTTTSGKVGTTTTGKVGTTTTTGSAQTYTYVFTDSLVSSFEDWSWGAVSIVSSPIYNGAYSWSFTPASYAAAYVSCPNAAACIKGSQYSALEFYIYSTVEITNQLYFAFHAGNPVNDAYISTYLVGGKAAAKTWTKATVPVPAGGSFDGFWFQESSGVTAATLYFDDIRFVNK